VKILIIEDEAKTAAYLQKGLSEEGFVADTAPTGDEGMKLAHGNPYDLIILDVMLPGRDGWSIMEGLRKEGKQTPVLFLTARDTVQDRVRGLELGADDYLVKPFEPLELVMRVKALLKRYRIATSQTVQIGELLIDHKTFEATVHGASVSLPRKEFELLFKLASYPGRTFSREQLIEDVWGYDEQYDDPRTIQTHVSSLRRKLGSAVGRRIVTFSGIGYRFD
jgi:DNA-binding response OmpR family regulator